MAHPPLDQAQVLRRRLEETTGTWPPPGRGLTRRRTGTCWSTISMRSVPWGPKAHLSAAADEILWGWRTPPAPETREAVPCHS